MIIDTGASVTVVDRQVFPEDLPEEADVQMTSGSVTGQIHDVHLVKAAKFKIGKRTIKEMPLAAIDLEYVNEMYDKHLNRKIIGLLGCDFLCQVSGGYRLPEKGIYHDILIIYHLKIRIICFFRKNIILLRINRA